MSTTTLTRNAQNVPVNTECDLPDGWEAIQVHEIFESFGGGTPDRGNSAYWGGAIAWLSSGDVKAERIRASSESITLAGLSNSSASLCQPGSVLVVVRSGILKHTLPVAVLEREVAINQDIKCFDCGNHVLNNWLALAFRSSAKEILSLNREGTTVQSVKYETLKEFVLTIPPVAEQRRILAKIEELFKQVNASHGRLAKVPRILKRFRQSVLAAACSGRLTEDWRQNNPQGDRVKKLLSDVLSRRKQRIEESGLGRYHEPCQPDTTFLSEVPEEWGLASMDQLTCFVTSGSRGWAKYYADSGPYFIRAENINTDSLCLGGVAHVDPPNNAEGRRTRIEQGDLLVTITGANVTKSALVEIDLPEAYVSQHVALVRPIDPSLGKFLYLWAVSPNQGRAKLINDAYGAGKPGLNLDNIKEMPVGLPPIDEQREIVQRVGALFNLTDMIEKRVEAATKRADKLTQAILAKAFRGELVPTEAELARRERRDYEPASVLLERIRAEHEESAATKGDGKRRHRTRPREE